MKRILLLLALIVTASLNGQIVDCSDLFFSEYVEGSSQNKAIEIYNPTTTTIDLSDYRVERFSNGASNSSGGGVPTLSGMLAPGDAFVLTNGETDPTAQFGYCDPILVALGDLAEPNGSYPTPMHMNGNDAIVLTKNGGTTIVDVFGRIGEDPGVAWSDPSGTWWTNDHTLIRKSTVLKGDVDGIDAFDPSLEWDSLPENTWLYLGYHECYCQNANTIDEAKNISYIMYPNPVQYNSAVIVRSTEKIMKIEVINMLGEKVLTTQSNTIITDKLAKGEYIVTINFFDGRHVNDKLIVE